MFVTVANRFTQTYAVDDGSVIQFIGNNCIFLTEQWFEYTAVCIETGCVQDRIFCVEEFRYFGFKFFVDVLRTANETY